jgi:aspartate aminotransferase
MTTSLEQPAPHAVGTAMSPNLRLNEVVADRRRRGVDTLHLGFGEARLPLVPELADVLAEATRHTTYSPVAGTATARESLAGYFRRRRLPTEASHVVLAPGSKPLLFATIAALDGDVYIPAPSWNSYAPQVALSGHTPIPVPIGETCGGLPDLRLLAGRIDGDRRRGYRPAAVIVNTPDNPTGTTASPAALDALCAVVADSGLALISDEIYRDLAHRDDGGDGPDRFASPAEFLPDRTVVCTGLSKSLAIGGWRIGGARFPAGGFGTELRDRVLAIASDVWSTLAAPMQAVAAYAFSEPPAVVDRLRRSRRMHGSIARACYEVCRSRGARVRRPTGGFYVYADFGARRREFAEHGAVDSASLADVLLADFGVAVLAGHHLGDDSRRLAFKVATTGFVGHGDDEQLAALSAPDAARLPHVRRRLNWLDGALAALGGTPTDRTT